VLRQALLEYCNDYLEVGRFRDYCPNGLQVEGRPEVRRVMAGVTACQALLDEAVAWQADALLVHHGYFWKGESPVVSGYKRQRLHTLLTHDINLLAYHLPLDAHPEVGNNKQLAALFGWAVDAAFSGPPGAEIALLGHLPSACDAQALQQHMRQKTGRDVTAVIVNDKPIHRIAWCSGGAQSLIEEAFEQGAQAYVSGEISEQTTHSARELGLHYFAIGHHASERYGVQALGAHLSERFGLEFRFVDIANPA